MLRNYEHQDSSVNFLLSKNFLRLKKVLVRNNGMLVPVRTSIDLCRCDK